MKWTHLVTVLVSLAVLPGAAACGGSPTAASGTERRLDGGSPAVFTFSGVVRLRSAGLESVEVGLSGDATRSTRTNAQGAFTFADVPGRNFVVTPVDGGYSFTPPKYELGPVSRTDLDFTAASRAIRVGDAAPDFAGVDQHGQPLTLYSHRGQVVFIDISADWCGSCRAEAPRLEALYQEYKDQGLQVLTILVDGSAAAWASTLKVTHPVIEDRNRAISAPYEAAWLPTNVLLDRTLTIRFWDNDGEGEDFDEAAILPLLKQLLAGSGSIR